MGCLIILAATGSVSSTPSNCLIRAFDPVKVICLTQPYTGCPSSSTTVSCSFVSGLLLFSFYSISGSSVKKQRGDEQYEYAAEAVLCACVQEAPADVPRYAGPPAARTRKPVFVIEIVAEVGRCRSESGRIRVAYFQAIASLLFKTCEIQPTGAFLRPILSCIRDRPEFCHRTHRQYLDKLKFSGIVFFFTDKHSRFYRLRQIPLLVDTNPTLSPNAGIDKGNARHTVKNTLFKAITITQYNYVIKICISSHPAPIFPSKNYSEKDIFLFKRRQCKAPLCINSDANPLSFKSNFFILHSFHGA